MTTDTTGWQGTSIQNERQDRIRRGLFDGFEETNGAGRVMDIKGTGWDDQEVVLINCGYSFNPAAGLVSEVLSLDAGADTDNRHALMTIPRDRQYSWPAGTSVIQDAGNPELRVEVGPTGLRVTNGTVFVGPNDDLQISVAANGDITITAAGQNINFVSATLTHNGTNIGDDHTHTDTAGTGAGTTSGPN